MTAAWSDSPADRPSFDAIQRELFAMQRRYDEALAAAAEATGRRRPSTFAPRRQSLPNGGVGREASDEGEGGDDGTLLGPRALPGPWVNQQNFVFMAPAAAVPSGREGGAAAATSSAEPGSASGAEGLAGADAEPAAHAGAK